MLRTFPIGGVHPPGNKMTAAMPVEPCPVPAVVTIPLGQHIGAVAVPCVQRGDRVLVGQLIGRADGFVSANIHSSVSGTVISVDGALNAQGLRKPAVTIQVEGDEWLPEIDRSEDIVRECALSPKEIIERISDMGIVGMGGATFPSHVKLTPPPATRADCLIINAVECEPYLTADHRLMLERGEQMLIGALILAKAIEVDRIYVGIESNKPDAIQYLSGIAENLDRRIQIVPLKMRYPQGGEKQLIAAVTGRQVPSKALPIAVGAVVQNAGTAYAVYEAVQKNKPLIDRIVTVTGDAVSRPSNRLVRIGTSIEELIEQCGGICTEGEIQIISGGPMMGKSISIVGSPVTKGSSGILVMSSALSAREREMDCVRCGKCVAACPMGLEPYLLNRSSRLHRFDYTEQHNIWDCIECGCCTYSCPANIPLLDWIKFGKVETMKIIKARAIKQEKANRQQ